MADYIDREAALRITEETGALETQSRIKSLPDADVKPVVRGKWIEDGYLGLPCVCSYCGGHPAIKSWHFCPYCGAEMREQEAKPEPAPGPYDLLHEEGGWNLQ